MSDTTKIFDKFDNLSPDYVPNNRVVEEVVEKETHPLGVYNANGCLLGYTWNSGDTVSLTIKDIDKLVASYVRSGQSIENYWTENQLEFNVYSLQGELLCSVTPDIESNSIMKLNVSELYCFDENSEKQSLDANCYGMELKVISKVPNEEESGDIEIHTLIDKGKYNLFIK